MFIVISVVMFVVGMILTSGVSMVIFNVELPPFIGLLSSLAFVVFFWFVIDKIDSDKNPKKFWITISSFVIIPIILFIVLMIIRGPKHTVAKLTDDDVWNKDPNTWTENEEEYVNDFFEYLHENDRWK